MFGDFVEPMQVSHGHLELNGTHLHQCPEPQVIQTGPQPKRAYFLARNLDLYFREKKVQRL